MSTLRSPRSLHRRPVSCPVRFQTKEGRRAEQPRELRKEAPRSRAEPERDGVDLRACRRWRDRYEVEGSSDRLFHSCNRWPDVPARPGFAAPVVRTTFADLPAGGRSDPRSADRDPSRQNCTAQAPRYSLTLFEDLPTCLTSRSCRAVALVDFSARDRIHQCRTRFTLRN